MYKINLHVFLILVSIWLHVKSAEFAPEQKNSRLKRNFKLNNLIVTNQVNTRTVDDCKTACSHAIGCIGFDYCHTPLPAICFTHVFNGYLLYNPDTDLEGNSVCSFYKKEDSSYLVANGLSVLIKSAFVKRRLLTIPPSSAPLATNSLQQTLKSDDPCQGGNLAFNKTATQSTQYQSNTAASVAVDGVLGNNDNDISHTLAANDSWWMVDLEYLSNITNVVVYNRISGAFQRLSNFNIRVGNCTDIKTHSLCTYFNDTVPADKFSVISCNQHMLGRFVSIQVTENTFLHGIDTAPFLVLREVVVVGQVICTDEIGSSTKEGDNVTRTQANSDNMSTVSLSAADDSNVYQSSKEKSDNNSTTPSGVIYVDDSTVHQSRKVMTIIAISLLSVMLIMAAIKALLFWYVDELNIFGRGVGARKKRRRTTKPTSFALSSQLSEPDHISTNMLTPTKEAEAEAFTGTMQRLYRMSLANKLDADSPESIGTPSESSGTPDSIHSQITERTLESEQSSYTSLQCVKKVKARKDTEGTPSLTSGKSNKSKSSQKSKNKNANALIVDNTLKSEDVTNYRCINNGNTLVLAKNTDNPSDGGSSALVKNNFNKINYLYTDKYRTLANINSNYGVNDVILFYSNKGCSVNPGRFRRLVSESETNPTERQFSRYYSNKDIPAGNLKVNDNVRNSTNSNSGFVEGESKASSNCSQLHKVRVGPVVCTVNGGGQESTNSESKNQCSNLTHLHNIPSNITGKQCGKFFITNSEGTKGTDVDCIHTVLHNVNRQFTTENNGDMLVNRAGKVDRKYRYRTTTEADEGSLDSRTKTVLRRNVTIAVQPIVTKSHHCDQLLHSNDCSAVDGNNLCQNASDTANTVDFGTQDFSRIGPNVDELSRDTEIKSNAKYN